MSPVATLRRPFTVGALIVCCAAIAWPVGESQAQDNGKPATTRQAPRGQNGVGGTSLTLRDVWGPAEMPPAPKDFGPHFDFPPEPLGGGLLHDPYPN